MALKNRIDTFIGFFTEEGVNYLEKCLDLPEVKHFSLVEEEGSVSLRLYTLVNYPDIIVERSNLFVYGAEAVYGMVRQKIRDRKLKLHRRTYGWYQPTTISSGTGTTAPWGGQTVMYYNSSPKSSSSTSYSYTIPNNTTTTTGGTY